MDTTLVRIGTLHPCQDDSVRQELVDRARAGDEQAFRVLTEPHRRELLAHCYRMLGSFADAEDMVQETLLAAWRGLDGFAGRASPRTWLYRIATNRCLNALRDAGRRRPAEPTPSFTPPEPSRRSELTWLQPFPDAVLDEVAESAPGPEARYGAKEAIELAFVAGLQHLPPRQAATLVLRDVLGYPAGEVADLLATSETAVKGTLQRARAGLREHLGSGADAPAADPVRRDLARRFAAAFSTGDIDGLLALLTDDAWLAMPPAPHEYHGQAAIAALLSTFSAWRGPRRLRLLATGANGQPAFGCYLTGPDGGGAHPAGLLVLTLAGERIAGCTWFLHDDLLRHFGLPETIAVT